MITAARHGKLRNYDLYEDEITSIIFGPLQYHPAHEVWDIFRNLSGFAGIKFWPEERPDRVEMKFWERTGPVEPDLIIEFYKGNENILNILLEVKWDAPLSPLCELVRQWGHRYRKNSNWIHLYLVKDAVKRHSDIQQSIDIAMGRGEPCSEVKCCGEMKAKGEEIAQLNLSPGVWKERLGCVGWRHFLKSIPGRMQNNIWGKGVERFLGKHDIAHLTGFEWLKAEPLISTENSTWFNC